MNNKYIWNGNEIRFLDNDGDGQDVEYSAKLSLNTPFEECSCNASCGGKCQTTQEARAYDLACEIYDEIISSTNAQSPQKILVCAKDIINKSEQLDKVAISFVICLKIQLIHEIQTQLNCVFSKEDKDYFING